MSKAERQFDKYADPEFWTGPEIDPDLLDELVEDRVYGALVNEWVNVVRRARLRATTKYIALLLATYANPDGTSIYPGEARLAVQSGYSPRTVEYELRRLRAMGLIEAGSRKGLPRHFSVPYRLTLPPDLLERVDVPSPAAEDAAVEKVRARRRGRHRKTARRNGDVQNKDPTARNPDCTQFDECAQWDDTNARNGQAADLQEGGTTLPAPLPLSNPPYAESSVVAPGTGSTRAREANGKPGFGSNQEEDKRRAELMKLEAWMKENTA